MTRQAFGHPDPLQDLRRVRTAQLLKDLASNTSLPGMLLENKVQLWPSDGGPISTFDATEAGVIAALAAAALIPGSTVVRPSIPIALTAQLTIPADTALRSIDLIAPLTFGSLTGSVPAFPSTPILDDFDRADEGPPPGAAWVTPTWNDGTAGHVGLKTASNHLVSNGNANGCVAAYNESFGPDCEFYATIAAGEVDVTQFECYLRADTNQLDNYFVAGNGYMLFVNIAASGGMALGKFSSGGTAFVGSADIAVGVGDSFGIRAIGSTITAFHKPSGGSWSAVITVTDATFSGAGYSGIMINDNTGALDDFGGGNVVAGDAPCLILSSGSRLSNTAVLQTANDAHHLTLVLGPDSVLAAIEGCVLETTQAGAGDAVALQGAAGNIDLRDTWLNGASSGGAGYGVIGDAGIITLYQCWIRGSSDPIGGSNVITYATRQDTLGGAPALGDRSASNALDFPDWHANDVDDSSGVHHTLGTGAAQAAAGDHTHAGGSWPSTFPATPILDDFNRADGLMGENWAIYPTDYYLKIDTNQVVSGRGPTLGGEMYYTHAFGPDAEAYITCVSIADGYSSFVIIGNDPNSGIGGYAVYYTRDDTGGDTIALYDAYASYLGISSTLGTVTVDYSPGDAIGVRAVGMTVKAYYKPAGGSWTEIISADVSASDYTRGNGYAVIDVTWTGALDDFGGGPLLFDSSKSPAVYDAITPLDIDTTLDGSMHVVFVSSGATITLPNTATYVAIEFVIVNVDSASVTVNPQSGQTISGAATVTLAQWDRITVVSGAYAGQDWVIISS